MTGEKIFYEMWARDLKNYSEIGSAILRLAAIGVMTENRMTVQEFDAKALSDRIRRNIELESAKENGIDKYVLERYASLCYHCNNNPSCTNCSRYMECKDTISGDIPIELTLNEFNDIIIETFDDVENYRIEMGRYNGDLFSNPRMGRV